MKKARKLKLKKKALLLVTSLLVLTYYLSTIPQLQVLPVLRQVNILLTMINLGITDLARAIANRLPPQLESVGTVTGDFYHYAKQNPVIIEFIIRKSAHIFFFFMITLAFFILCRHYLKPAKAVTVSFVCGTLAAIVDETIQYFVAGRHGSIIDVAIDMVGVSLAIILIAIAFLLIKPIYIKSD